MSFIIFSWLYHAAIYILLIVAALYAYFKYQYGHFRKRGLPAGSPTFPLGNYQGLGTKKTMDLLTADIYKAHPNERVVGAYFLARPVIVVRDMEIIKCILVKDFGKFHDRGIKMNIKNEPLNNNIFGMNGQEWRNLRIQMTPTFTSGKMKMMFPTLVDVGKKLETVLEASTLKKEVEIKEILARYTTDVISSVVFGIESNSLENPDVEFRTLSKKLLHPTIMQQLAMFLMISAPEWIAENLPLRVFPKDVSDFFVRIVRETMDYRVENNFHRNDFLQLLLELKTTGFVRDADNPQNEEIGKQQKFTFEQAAAQAFIFFFAGFETSSATMQFALYELALNPEIQQRLQQEIDQVLAKNDGKLTYESILHFDYLDRVVDETLRKYPPAGTLFRECNQELSIPDSDIKFMPGDKIWLPIYGIQNDPKYFPDPEKFDPDRFLPENKENRPHFAYMPFGEGPRSCIGNRFALMQTKVGLATLLAKFTVSPSENTPIPLKFDPKVTILTPLGLLAVNVKKRV